MTKTTMTLHKQQEQEQVVLSGEALQHYTNKKEYGFSSWQSTS